MAGGVIAEQGTHEELLAKDGIYRELYETQFRTVIDNELGEQKHEEKKEESGKQSEE